jgi:hypothetical protein
MNINKKLVLLSLLTAVASSAAFAMPPKKVEGDAAEAKTPVKVAPVKEEPVLEDKDQALAVSGEEESEEEEAQNPVELEGGLEFQGEEDKIQISDPSQAFQEEDFNSDEETAKMHGRLVDLDSRELQKLKNIASSLLLSRAEEEKKEAAPVKKSVTKQAQHTEKTKKISSAETAQAEKVAKLRAAAAAKKEAPTTAPVKEKAPAAAPVKEKAPAAAPVKEKAPAVAPVKEKAPAVASVKEEERKISSAETAQAEKVAKLRAAAAAKKSTK